ncbi:hypothetical protein WME89_40950 [Sorangium sp. So ce321]|uniref:hypothetical protein n=1 Tax=Sorangium sp. So ce321 TaxID=3133300 RepID=UPI003F5F58CB
MSSDPHGKLSNATMVAVDLWLRSAIHADSRKKPRSEIKAAIEYRVRPDLESAHSPAVVEYIMDGMARELERRVGRAAFKPEDLTNKLLAALYKIQAKSFDAETGKLARVMDEAQKNARRNKRKAERTVSRIAALQEVRKKHHWIVGLPIEQVIAAQRTMLHTEILMRLMLLLVPRRLVDEEFVDAIEVVASHFKRSAARWPAYIKLVTATLWLVVHAVGYAASKLKGSKKASGE